MVNKSGQEIYKKQMKFIASCGCACVRLHVSVGLSKWATQVGYARYFMRAIPSPSVQLVFAYTIQEKVNCLVLRGVRQNSPL